VAPAWVDSISLDEPTVDDARRPAGLGPVLSAALIELVLERTDARKPVRTVAGPTPALSVTVSVRAVDVGAGPLTTEALHQVAALAITHFLDQGFLAVVRPSQGPTFLFPLPSMDDALDEVAALCRQLDDERLRQRAVACAERFRVATERLAITRDLLIEVWLGEGSIAGAPGFVGLLLPASAWRAV
jgi:hypothetical protein